MTDSLVKRLHFASNRVGMGKHAANLDGLMDEAADRIAALEAGAGGVVAGGKIDASEAPKKCAGWTQGSDELTQSERVAYSWGWNSCLAAAAPKASEAVDACDECGGDGEVWDSPESYGGRNVPCPECRQVTAPQADPAPPVADCNAEDHALFVEHAADRLRQKGLRLTGNVLAQSATLIRQQALRIDALLGLAAQEGAG